ALADPCPSPAAAGCGSPCGPLVWGSAEFLYWATQGVHVPPLVTTGPATTPGVAATLGNPTTDVLFGNRRMLDQFRPGFQAEVGTYFGEGRAWGASGRFFFLGEAADRFDAGANQFPVLAVPQLLPS